MTLQEERNARTEEEASLRGTIRALEAQLSSAQAAVSTAVEGRQQANEDASRLRTEVEKVTRQRDELQIDLTQQREELSRQVTNSKLQPYHCDTILTQFRDLKIWAKACRYFALNY